MKEKQFLITSICQFIQIILIKWAKIEEAASLVELHNKTRQTINYKTINSPSNSAFGIVYH